MNQFKYQLRRIKQSVRKQHQYYQYLRIRRLVQEIHSSTLHSWSVTCQGKSDGGGAQWHACFSVMALAHHLGLTYHHSPFLQIEHGPIDSKAWIASWNGLFQLGPPLEVDNLHRISCASPLDLAQRILNQPPSSGALFVLEHAHGLTNRQPQLMASLRPFLRQAYRPSPVLPLPPSPLHKTLVVHVRRGDVQVDGNHCHRFTSSVSIAATCRQVLARHPHLQQVLLLSASPDADLLALCRNGFLLDSKHDVFTHLHWMSQAGCLVIAKSSLSYLGGLLNPYFVFAEHFEHPPLPDWTVLPTAAI